MIHHGACHCGAVRVELETEHQLGVRADGCSFCAGRGVRSASDPDGALRIRADHRLTRYRFGHRTADFLICATCGTYVAAVMDSVRGPVGVVNVAGTAMAALRDLDPEWKDFDGEGEAERIARRLTRWTPTTVIEG